MQVRRAQRTYRLRKEATLENLRSRVAILERTLGTVSGLVDHLHDTVTLDDSLSPSHRILLDQIQTSLHSLGPRRILVLPDDEFRSGEQDLDVFGYHVSHIPAALHGSIFTYSHLERTFARRLHRFALEQTYTWFTDRSASPGWIVHVFGLLPCLPDRHAVQRNYLRVLRAGVDECLEGRVLPFYTIGGAGMHYPRRDAAGQPVYPQNMREPKRILDRAVEAMLGRGGDAISGKQQRQLQTLGFEGEWFDCHDVQEYLDSLGITLDGSISSASVPPGAVQLLSEAAEPETLRLDVEQFLSSKPQQMKYLPVLTSNAAALVQNTRILGRAPGFKKSDVDDALKAAMQFS